MEESRPQTHHLTPLTPLAPCFQRTRILDVCVQRGTVRKRAVADTSAPQHQRANARRGRELSATAPARIPHLSNLKKKGGWSITRKQQHVVVL